MFGLESLVIFVIIWWRIFFITLPFGVSKDEEVIYGNDPGAPKKTLLKKKILVSTIISFILTIIVSVVKNEIF